MNFKEKTDDELKIKLHTSVQLIQDMLEKIKALSLDDPMRFEFATVIATKLRVLLLDTGNNKSLIHQLGIKEKLLFPMEYSNVNDIASNLVFASQLVSMIVANGQRLYCEPIIPEFSHKLSCTFDTWWNEIVIDTNGLNYSLVTRCDIVRVLADKEGGAHEDHYHSDDYCNVNYSSGYILIDNNGKEHHIQNNYYVESLIVIAYEFLDAIDVYKKYVYGKKQITENTRFNAIKISYLDEKSQWRQSSTKNRYYKNTDENLWFHINVAFDYYRKAKYELIYLYGLIYYDPLEETIIRFLVVDSKKCNMLVYLRPESNDDLFVRKVLIKRTEGYIRVAKDADIYDNTDYNTLSYYLDEYSGGNKSIYRYYLEMQMIPIE